METLTARKLVKIYKKRKVVNEVSFEIKQGEIVGLLGPNGAGKTTTFYMVVGLVRPNSGRVIFSGEDITNEPMHIRARRGIGYLAQEPSIFRKLTVEENVLAILEVIGYPKEKRRDRADELLEELNIAHLAKSIGYTLSGGERRRVEISRALSTSPYFLLLDEPFTGVDPLAVSDIQNIIYQLKGKGLGVLITDHSVRETLAITDRTYLIHNGRVLMSGTSHEIANSEIARKFYLGENFRWEKEFYDQLERRRKELEREEDKL